MSKKIGLLAGPLLFFIFQQLSAFHLNEDATVVISLALWMVCWWISEAVPIAVTSLLPLIIFPLFGIMEMNEVGANYGSSIVFLFFGGFVLALALEKAKLHQRIALRIIQKTGTSPNRIVLGFMLATALLSMWISNTASTVVMLPIALSVIQLLIKSDGIFSIEEQRFSMSVMLGIAFSANAGGIATIIGTPPNSVMIGLLENEFNIEISFFKWMLVGLPFSSILLAVIYFLLTKVLLPSREIDFKASRSIINGQIEALGPISKTEKHVLVIFAVTVFLWVFRGLINRLLPDFMLSDTLISVGAAVALFAVPFQFQKNRFILEWKDTEKLAWGILLLFGGGLALAKGMSITGLVDAITQSIAQASLPIFLTVALLITLMLFMTELMSNVALVAVLAPVIAGIAIGLNVPLLHLLIPITMASSCAFMLPMATPPNAIVFASEHIKVAQMVRAGFWINLASIGLLLVFYKWVIPFVFPLT